MVRKSNDDRPVFMPLDLSAVILGIGIRFDVIKWQTRFHLNTLLIVKAGSHDKVDPYIIARRNGFFKMFLPT